ncbi:MAG: PQQ-binding-like beta-propeller repeat protein, partial [Planctomycetota bacterium]
DLQRKSDHVIALDAALESTPVVLGNSVVVGPRSGRLQSFSLADGSASWSKPLENLGDVLGAVRVYGSDLFFLGTDGAVYRFAANGRKSWRKKIPDAIGYPGRPLSSGTAVNHCFLSTKRGRVAAISLESGDVTWHRTLTSGALSAPVVAGERVIAVDRQGRVYCVDAKTGEPDWKADVHGEVVVEPVVAGDRVLIATTDGRLVALHLERGEELWSENLEEPLQVAPVAVVGEYLAITQSGRLTIGALADGRARLAAQVPGRFTISRPAADGRHGYLVDDEGHVLALRLADASQSWSYTCGGTPGGNLVVAGGRLILGAVDRGLHVLTLDSEAESNR